ncbi:MAG: alpha/beta hydrolase [Erysipelotrichaceae bacterium]|nr:alpha/beta hydrolase [Erysipelotrichaceae bacterium]
MRRIILVLLIILLILTGCKKKPPEPVGPEKITAVKTEGVPQGGYVSSFTVSGHDIFVYMPEDIMNANIINYGYSAPLLLVFPDEKLERKKAVEFVCEKGIDRIAQNNGGAVVVVNPQEDWDKEEYGVYEDVLAETMVGQTGFSHGLLYDASRRQYYIFASPAMTVAYGYGKGADYIGKHYIKETSGLSAMSSLGSNDITMTAAVLENLSVDPDIKDKNIIVVSVKNSDSVNRHIERNSNQFHQSDESFDQIFEEYIEGWQRWNGKVAESFSLKKSGLEMHTHVFEVDTSADNRAVSSGFHRIGAVVFRRKDSTGKKPLVLCFHGGGDTALATATIAGWPQLARSEDFILCAPEMHTLSTATEIMAVVDKLKEIYEIDETRIYATGFSMGGIKTWDMYQEYPAVFAALAPMAGTVLVGRNSQFRKAPVLNEDVMVPVFYSGGQSSDLRELPVQSQDVVERINYLFTVNKVPMPFEMSMARRSEWQDSVYGYQGDIVEEHVDPANPDSTTTIRYYYSEDGRIYTALCSITRHKHEIRPFTVDLAWQFMKKYSRVDGRIVISE